ncbi:MAG: hypothetical protein LBN01_01845 [Endomicrobium sp.]|jgi:mRNA-degrading endonuclease YafQ of YafQ-DinJ toxin-antitoxin module|nr:hypothetical protein [Endomicrobium sp.]
METIEYFSIPKFEKDFKRLQKRFKTLEEDFENMKKAAIEVYHLRDVKTFAVLPIEGFCGQDYLSMKVKKMTCKSLKGKGVQSGLRVIYVFKRKENSVTFIEMYYKQDQENEDKNRLSDFIKNIGGSRN